MKKVLVSKRKSFVKIACLFLALILGAVCLLFAGCWDGEDGTTFFGKYVAGFNAVYANKQDGGNSSLRPEDDLTDDMLGNIKDGMLSNYGNGAYNTYFYGNAPFPDSIRMLVTNNNGQAFLNTSGITSWKWKINSNYTTDNFESLITSDTVYSSWASSVLGYLAGDKLYIFDEKMSDVLQIVLYEIMLGYEDEKLDLTKLTVDTSNGYEIKVVFGNYTGTESQQEKKLEDYKEQLQNKYLSKTRYTGLTKDNADGLISYILTEIIGEDLVVSDWYSFRNEAVNFRNYVSTIAYLIYSQTYDGSGDEWVYEFKSGTTEISYVFNEEERIKAVNANLLGQKQEGASAQNPNQEAGFSAKAATYVQYFEGETLFGAQEGDQFEGRPYAEYQSVVVVPAKSLTTLLEGGLELEAGFVFSFMSKNQNLEIRTKVRYYAVSASGQSFFYEFDGATVEFKSGSSYVNSAGETCWENSFDFGVPKSAIDSSLVKTEKDKSGSKARTYTIGFFENKDLLNSVKNEQSLIAKPSLQRLFKVQDSQNGYGAVTVLDERRVNSPFFEITFDVIKKPSDPENTDYNFSLVLLNTALFPGIW